MDENEKRADSAYSAGNHQPDDTYPNGEYQQNNGYPNGEYQQNNGYPNGEYQQNNGYSNGEYQQNNGYPNGEYQQNNTYPNGAYQQNSAYQNGAYQQNDTYQNGNYQPYQQYRPYAPAQQPYGSGQPDMEVPVSVGEWILSMIILMVPCVNIIMVFVWAFSQKEKKSKSNFFKAYLISVAIAVLIGMLVCFAVALMGASLLS